MNYVEGPYSRPDHVDHGDDDGDDGDDDNYSYYSNGKDESTDNNGNKSRCVHYVEGSYSRSDHDSDDIGKNNDDDDNYCHDDDDDNGHYENEGVTNSKTMLHINLKKIQQIKRRRKVSTLFSFTVSIYH